MKLETINAVKTGAVLQITLNRPESRNAMSLTMVAELQQALGMHASPVTPPDEPANGNEARENDDGDE